MRRAFCRDENCNGLHQEPFAVCTCGWSKWLAANAGLENADRVIASAYERAKADHLKEVK
jgi:hypothetical protein